MCGWCVGHVDDVLVMWMVCWWCGWCVGHVDDVLVMWMMCWWCGWCGWCVGHVDDVLVHTSITSPTHQTGSSSRDLRTCRAGRCAQWRCHIGAASEPLTILHLTGSRNWRQSGCSTRDHRTLQHAVAWCRVWYVCDWVQLACQSICTICVQGNRPWLHWSSYQGGSLRVWWASNIFCDFFDELFVACRLWLVLMCRWMIYLAWTLLCDPQHSVASRWDKDGWVDGWMINTSSTWPTHHPHDQHIIHMTNTSSTWPTHHQTWPTHHPHNPSQSPMFSFTRLSGSDPVLGVEMASTGEVACFGTGREEALLKSIVSANFVLPKKAVLLCANEAFLHDMVHSAFLLSDSGYKLFATNATHEFLARHGVETGEWYVWWGHA